jgi:hypothetical protein
MTIGGPQFIEGFFVQKQRSQIRLGIEIYSQNALTKFRTHPCDVIDQRGLADTAFGVEECNRLHDLASRIVAKKRVGSRTLNSAGGLPFSWRNLCVRAIPRPNRST